VAVYTIVSDGLLHVKGKTIAFKSKEGETRYLPLKTTDGIIVSGNVRVSSGYLTSPKIPVTVFVKGVRPRSVLLPIQRKIDSVSAVRSFMEHRLEVARSIELVAAEHFRESLTGLPTDRLRAEALDAFRNATSVEELRGIEGKLYKEFYSILDLFLPQYLQLGSREYHPPPNPGNAVVSYINSLIYSYLLIWLVSAGLPTELAFIHEPNKGSIALALDVAEIFRPFLLPKTLFLALRKYHLTQKDFVREGVATYLNTSGRRKVVRAFLEETQRFVKIGKRRLRVESYAKLVAARLKKAFKDQYAPNIPHLTGWV